KLIKKEISMHRKKRFWYHLMLAGLLIKSSVLASAGNQDTARSIAPRLRADFQSGLPELSIAPGETRLGRGGNRGIARKHPYSVRKVAPNLRNSLLEYVRQDEAVGKQVLALEEDMTVDVLGALNL